MWAENEEVVCLLDGVGRVQLTQNRAAAVRATPAAMASESRGDETRRTDRQQLSASAPLRMRESQLERMVLLLERE